uniref:Uncharacterized protein n=1 Tax=Arion vulgaris TaxID=1028688 RepID=A0A0B7B175_9EUPU
MFRARIKVTTRQSPMKSTLIQRTAIDPEDDHVSDGISEALIPPCAKHTRRLAPGVFFQPDDEKQNRIRE